VIGKTLAHYEILEKIGEGGMGEVYRARDLQLDRDVAVKLLPEAWTRDSGRIRRLEREAKTLASLEHPNIATVYGFHEDHGAHLLVMELVDGSALTAFISEEGLPLDRLLDIGIPLASAISFAHARGVVHRDLKPANVMLDSSGRLRVLDFGLATLRTAAPDEDADATLQALTGEGEIAGTVAYMAPEQLEGRVVDARADVFAIGVMLHELAAGNRPFRADSAAGLASAILRDEPTSLRELRPDLPADLARVVRRCLRKDVDRRIQTVKDVQNELEDLRAGVRTEGTPAVAASARPGELIQNQMRITTEHVRSLSAPIPRMVGDSMTYLDNGRESDVLVLLVPGIGSDEREFRDVLQRTLFRATAISLYGLGPTASIRPPISFADHNRLLALLIEEICRRIAPRTVVLVGMSAGADQALHILGSDDAKRVRTDGIILLGPVVRSGDAPVGQVYSQLSEDPTELLKMIQSVAATADALDSWLYVHEYLIGAFGKLGTDVAALREFSRGYVEGCDERTFFPQLRAALKQARVTRCVFSVEERASADFVLDRHIQENALGEHFTEETIVTDAARRHSQLGSPAVLLPLVEEVARLAGAGGQDMVSLDPLH
jgi:serine/threonine protein kinase